MESESTVGGFDRGGEKILEKKMKMYRSGVLSLLLFTPLIVLLSVSTIGGWIASLIGGVIIFLGIHQRWGSVITLGLGVLGINFLYHTIWTAFGLANMMFITGFFFYLFTVQTLSSNLIEFENIKPQNGEEVLIEYMSATHHRLFEQILGAFLVTMAGEFIAWNSIIGISISESNALFFFLIFGGTFALLLFLILERLPEPEG